MDGKSERISFLIYNAYYKSIEHLPDEKLGKLFRAMFEYQNNMESKLEPEIQMAFNFIKNQFIIKGKCCVVQEPHSVTDKTETFCISAL